MLHITKRFPGIIANDDITLQLKRGEIHALLGDCELIPTAKIALETSRVQEGIKLSQQLRREILADEIDKRPGSRDLSQLARQYRETLKEIEEIEGMNRGDDEIEEIISGREADGESRAVRPDRTKLH